MNPDSRLLHLPQSSRYAITAALYLAAIRDTAYHMVGEIAGQTALSPSYLSKILQRLANKGLLDSRRGAKGGYRLNRPAAGLSLADIVAGSHRADKAPMPCMVEARNCDCAHPCAMHKFVADTEETMWRRLRATTLENFSTSPLTSGVKQ